MEHNCRGTTIMTALLTRPHPSFPTASARTVCRGTSYVGNHNHKETNGCELATSARLRILLFPRWIFLAPGGFTRSV